MSIGKAPGSDVIPAEVFKAGGTLLIRKLTDLFQFHWEKKTLPQEFRDATIVHIYKRKENKRSCDNHIGIFLFSIAVKILARVLLNRLLKHLEQGGLPESQCRFRETIDMILQLVNFKNNVWNNNKTSMTFVDFTKAFDSVSRNGLWKILAKFGCPEKFVKTISLFHDGIVARVLNEGGSSELF